MHLYVILTLETERKCGSPSKISYPVAPSIGPATIRRQA